MEAKTRETAIELKAEGLTYRQVANQMGISPQRIQQLFSPRKTRREHVIVRADEKCESCGTRIKNGHIHHKSYDPKILNRLNNLLYLCPSCHAQLTEHSNKQQNVEAEQIDYRDWNIYHEECSDSDDIHYHILCGYKSLADVQRLVDWLMDNNLEPDCHW